MTTTTNGATLEHEIGATGSFRLRQLSGSIFLRGVDGGTARVVERNGKSLAEGFHIETGEHQLSLTAPDRVGLNMVFDIGRRSSFDLEVEVPRGAAVSIESASAELQLSDLTNQLRVRTASGDLTLDRIAGTLELDAVSGDARIEAAGALDLRARTISGDLSVRAPRLGRAEIGTTSGDIRVDAVLAGTGPFGIETVSGDATIVGRMGLRIEARTVTGDLGSELPHRREAGPGRKQLVVGDGAIPFSFRSVSGDLRVTTPRDSLPAGVTTGESPAVAPDAPVPPVPPTTPSAPVPPAAPANPGAGSREVARMDVLRALERGELSVEAAMRRIAEIEEA
ncbi:MAG TPA: DUF4097 family beta strand repeat-containing protein [Candidatus Limnocylindrales bacterium]|nr:DUF4097 family beta strand repeat-containing protein [Candidatus Limnocylindrales bacterium]